MRNTEVFVHNFPAGTLKEEIKGREYIFVYHDDYSGEPVSLTMPVSRKKYHFKKFPPFFEGLLPEGPQLESLLRIAKIDRDDLFSQLISIGLDTVGAVTLRETP